MLEEDEADGLNGGGRPGARAGRQRRAGELYDAFAAGSEDESDGEYVDGLEDEDVREKQLYKEDDDMSDEGKHVIGEDEDDEEDEASR